MTAIRKNPNRQVCDNQTIANTEGKNPNMLLYHFTTVRHWLEIVASGQINTTNSDVVRPVAPHVDVTGGKYVDETDAIHPCVWLTSNPDASVESLSLEYGEARYETKNAVRLTLEKAKDMYFWDAWRKRYARTKEDREYQETMKSLMSDWDTVYVCERPVSTSEIIETRVSIDAIEHAFPEMRDRLMMLFGGQIEKSKDGFIYPTIG